MKKHLGWSDLLCCNNVNVNGIKIVNFTYLESEKLRSVFWREAKKAKSHHPIENFKFIKNYLQVL